MKINSFRTLRILTYHRVMSPTPKYKMHKGVISATPKNFEKQIRYLIKHFNIITFEDLEKYFNKHKHLPKKTLVSIMEKQAVKDEEECEICKRTHWKTKINNKEFTLLIPIETDHIDGNVMNNEDSNKRRICRQCHANTPTFSHRNPKYKE